MSSIVAASFCCVIVACALGLEWADVNNGAFALAALVAVILFSAFDAWVSEVRTGNSQDFRENPQGAPQTSVESDSSII